MRRRPIRPGARWRAIALAALVLAAAPRMEAKPAPGQPETSPMRLKVPVLYRFDLFTEREGWPGHDTSHIVLRSPKKPRPLYVTGRGAEGSLEVTFRDLGPVESLIDSPEVGRLMGLAAAKNEFAVKFYDYSASPPDAARTAASAWAAARERPALYLKVREVAGWSFVIGKDGRPVHETYQAVLKGALEAAGRSRALEAPVTVRFIDKEADAAAKPARMVIAGSVRLAGAELGLAGDDAGEIEAAFTVEGYTSFLEDQPAPAEGAGEVELPTLD